MVLLRRVLCPLVVAAAFAGIVSGPALGQAAYAETAPVSNPADAQSAPDEATASAIAQLYGHAVRVDGQTTAQTSVSAEPNGEFQYEADSLPVRVQQSGSWIDVDETLAVDASGMLAPRASAAPVRFSAGGSNVLDEVQTPAGDWITEKWPYGNLPVPTVTGSTATYVDVLPDVDLKLTATVTGMSDVVVVKSSAAAASEALSALRMSIGGAQSVTAAASDTMTAKTVDGSAVVADSPLWWDSSNGATFLAPGGDDPERPVVHTTNTTGMTLDVAATVSGASPTYPIYIDPSDWSSGDAHTWYTDAAYPAQTYYDANVGSVLRVGISAPYRSDMFWQFPLPSLPGAVVSNAVVNTTQVWAGTCSPSPIDVHVYGPRTPGFNWNTEQSYGASAWQGILQSQNPNFGCSGVGAGAVGWTVTSGIAAQISAGSSSVQLGWTYHDPNSQASRRHYATTSALVITYDRPPAVPTSPTFSTPARSCATSASSPAIFNGNQPITLSVHQTDPDAGNVATDFFVGATSNLAAATKYTTPLGAQGTKTWTFASGTFSPGTYAWRARGSDYVLTSGYSAWCYFTIDDTAPAAPTASTTATDMTIGVGVPVTIGPGAATDVAGYEYWVSRSSTTSPAPSVPVTLALPAALPVCGSQKGAATFVCSVSSPLTVAPIDDTSVLWVASYDAAGNVSTATPLPLVNSDGSPAALANTPSFHSWPISTLGTPLPSVIPDANTTAATDTTGEKDLTVGSGVDLSTTDTINSVGNVPVLAFPGTASAANTATTASGAAGAAIDTTASFTASAWVNPAVSTGTLTIMAQSGSSKSGFVLEDNQGTMTFCLQPQVGTSGPDCVAAASASAAGQWVMVTGIWDAVDHQMRIVLGNVTSQEVVAPHVPPTGDTSAVGSVTIGSAEAAAAPVNAWNGKIVDPLLVQEVVDTTTLNSLRGNFP